jgi:hypothetical protein
MNSKLAIVLLVVGTPCWAQQAPATKLAPPATVTEAPRSGEPDVKRSVIEDQGSRIEELRIRGDTQRIVVTPKVGVRKSYEILTGDASRDAFDGTGGARSSAGRRVWNVLDF